jgi:hypothetical protein
MENLRQLSCKNKAFSDYLNKEEVSGYSLLVACL